MSVEGTVFVAERQIPAVAPRAKVPLASLPVSLAEMSFRLSLVVVVAGVEEEEPDVVDFVDDYVWAASSWAVELVE